MSAHPAESAFVAEFMAMVREKHPGEVQFHQAVHEIVESVAPLLNDHPEYRKHKVMERLVEPERVISFRVNWHDDAGEIHVNRGYRVQMNNAIGPYKGGLRFHRSVDLDTLKFLAFEQVFKNSLTTLPLGGGKGGSDFDPKGKSDNEVMRFCQSFMMGLYRYIGPNTDVPAGDIGVGSREIGYLFGQYRRLCNEFTPALTGKGFNWGGSHIRPEATGYGCVYLAKEMLAHEKESIEGKTCLVSGAGNVAQYTVEKLIQLGAKPVTLSDSDGYIFDEAGIDEAKLAWVLELKNERRGRIREYADKFKGAVYTAVDSRQAHNPLWAHRAYAAFPSATQNEMNAEDAAHLIRGGARIIVEGSNMSCTPEAIHAFHEAGVILAPAKAANAGGVAVSGLEMSQNSLRYAWTREEVDSRLQGIMKSIHQQCLLAAERYGRKGNYVHGANIAGFLKVADAMIDQGVL